MSNHYTLKSIIVLLTQKQKAYISPEDADLWHLRWCAHFMPHAANGGKYRVVRNTPRVNGKKTLEFMHRVILSRVLGRTLSSKELVDHIDLNPLNNRRSNLRLSTPSQNCCNAAMRSHNTSGFKGVDQGTGSKRWRARIRVENVVYNLGTFDTPEEAYAAYCEAAKEKHGKYARLK